ncbi:MAG: phosphorylase [Bacteroidales bacterium]|jgi:uridine phosphorylase|nr:phosphorylase [Bacteroidales bacterium]
MRIPESELIINGNGSVFHLHMKPEQLADNVIMMGDPGRIDILADYLSDIECRNAHREFVSITGKYKGKRITAVSHGIGPDNIDIVMTELDALANVDFQTREVKPEHRTLNILRIGTSGALHADIPLGSYVLSHISVGFDGVMNWYGNREKITIPEVEEAFKKHMNWPDVLPSPYFVKASPKIIDLMKDITIKGATISAPGFYGPQGRVVRIPLAMPHMLEDIESFRFSTGGEDYRITNFEMESSPLAGMAAHLGHNACTVCCIIANRYLKSTNTDYKPIMRQLVETSLERMASL